MTELDDILAKYVTAPDAADKPQLVALYGPPGGGKTFGAATASQLPGTGKILILDVEGSTVGALKSFDPERIDIIKIYEMAPEDQFVKTNTFLEAFFAKETNYTAVIIDTFDVLQNLAEKHYGKTFTGWDIWREVGEWSTRVATNLKRIKPVGVLVVHEKETRSETGPKFSGLNLKGSAKDTLPGIPDVVAYLERYLDPETDEPATFWHFESDKTRVTKNRFTFPAVLKNATFPQLWKYIDDNSKENSK